jgi:hypothetical protein
VQLLEKPFSPTPAYRHLQYEKGVILLGESVDPYFHQPLWLQIPVKNQTLWAYHPAHLHFLKALIGAGLRERNGMDKAN